MTWGKWTQGELMWCMHSCRWVICCGLDQKVFLRLSQDHLKPSHLFFSTTLAFLETAAVNWLQNGAIEAELAADNFPNLYIPTVKHSWLTKIEIVKCELSCSCLLRHGLSAKI